MSTSNPPKVTVPAEMPPEAPPELIAKRDPLIAELENAAKSATGSLQQVLRKLAGLLKSTTAKPGAPIDVGLFEDVKMAFERFSKEPPEVIAKKPAILNQGLEWMQTYLASRGFPVAGAAPAAPSAAGGKRAGNDSFESGASQRARALSGEAPPPPAQQGTVGSKEQIESIKNWQMNPGLGKVKG
ncbi:hypothetical protein [Archangium sp.]|uniref:hypothetical protein n=1 Tax=Archangium sp. TaxID=1872627 RepID=UPI00389A5ACE